VNGVFSVKRLGAVSVIPDIVIVEFATYVGQGFRLVIVVKGTP